MNDPEVWRRREVMELMSPICECAEHAGVTLAGGGRGQIDVLCRPKAPLLTGFSLAIEIKSHSQIGDRELGPWLKQATDYVGAIPENGWPPIAASFVWMLGMQLRPSKDEQLRMAGMLQLAQHFRVGRAYGTNSEFILVFGPSADIFRRGNWTPKAAELLGAKRVMAGQRKTMEQKRAGNL